MLRNQSGAKWKATEDGEHLSNVRFADDIFLMTVDLIQAQVKLQQLSKEASKVGLKMSLSKAKVMTNIGDDRDIKIGETVIERDDNHYVNVPRNSTDTIMNIRNNYVIVQTGVAVVLILCE